MTIVLATPPYQQFYDANGDPLNGGKIYTYLAGTTAPRATYTDQGGGTPCANPIILDSAGRGVWWYDNGASYKIIVKDSADVTIQTIDNINPFSIAASSIATIASNTIVGNNTGATASPVGLTTAQTTAMLDAVVGDSGSGGTKGLVPAPGSGDAAANKYLKASGAWAAVAGTTLGTPTATTSGTTKDYTSIPAGVKRIAIMFSGVSLSGTSDIIIQLGDSGGVETTGYLSQYVAGTSIYAATTGFGIAMGDAGATANGLVILSLENSSSNTWVASGNLSRATASANFLATSGIKSLSATLDRVRIASLNGTDTFDAGEFNISYE